MRMYYHPDDLKNIDSSLKSVPHYLAVVEFIKALERLVPQCLDDLRTNVFPLLTPEVAKSIRMEQYEQPNSTELDVVMQSSVQPVVFFRNALLSWAREYRLVSENNLYIHIAYQTLSSHAWRHSIATMLTDGLRKAFGFSPLAAPSDADEPFSLLDGLRLHEQAQNDNLFDLAFPFVFSPSRKTMQRWDADEYGLPTKVLELDWQNPTHYESLSQHDTLLGNTISGILKGQKSVEELSQIGSPYWIGIGWNPKGTETWEEFEKKMDQAYENYKRAYKNRADAAISALGIQEVEPKDSMYHFEWLVLNRVLGKTHREIADYHQERTEKDISESAVQKQLGPLSKRVLLT